MPQQHTPNLPTRATLIIDFTHMFNQVSSEELFGIFVSHFPELIPFITLIYNTPSTLQSLLQMGN